mmetsp:Transcript_6062/g.10282  ORF Transcript_6062/g.10282 Transcript_6062/m.10282 type:complete len:186 (-) Transcript_6062:377-934(-)
MSTGAFSNFKKSLYNKNDSVMAIQQVPRKSQQPRDLSLKPRGNLPLHPGNLSHKGQEYESQLLSRFFAPPNIPAASEYSHAQKLARVGEGRGPYLAGGPYSSNSNASQSMQRRLKQQQQSYGKPSYGKQMKSLAAKYGAGPGKPITYKDQSEVMREIFGAKVNPRKQRLTGQAPPPSHPYASHKD